MSEKLLLRNARRDELARIVAMLADDALGRSKALLRRCRPSRGQ